MGWLKHSNFMTKEEHIEILKQVYGIAIKAVAQSAKPLDVTKNLNPIQENQEFILNLLLTEKNGKDNK